MEHEAFRILGTPRFGGILVVSDHASNRVPADIDLGIAPELLDQHVAIDIGVGAIGAIMAERPGIAAFQGAVSRLVCDFNRDEHLPTVVPVASDGHAIPGNALDHAGHEARLARFFRPYHEALAATIEAAPPALILSLHSFTPRLATSEEPRPWHVGVLYNADERAARLAIPSEQYEAASVDGASNWQKFKYITWPSMRTMYLTSTILSMIWTLGDFNSVYLLTGGGPADLTHVLATLGIRYLRLDQVDLAMASIVVALPMVLPLVYFMMKRLSK